MMRCMLQDKDNSLKWKRLPNVSLSREDIWVAVALDLYSEANNLST